MLLPLEISTLSLSCFVIGIIFEHIHIFLLHLLLRQASLVLLLKHFLKFRALFLFGVYFSLVQLLL